MGPQPPRSRTPQPRRGTRWRLGILFLSVLALVLAWRGHWWGLPLVALELFQPLLSPAWPRLHQGVDGLRKRLAPLKRFPGALVGLGLLFIGLGLGLNAPQTVQWLGDGVAAAVTGLARAAPVIIFFTLTPAIATILAAGRAGRFALWVNVAYVLTTIVAGLYAILLVVPIFGLRLAGAGATQTEGATANLVELAFRSPPFLAIFTAVGLGLMIHGAGLSGLREATRFVGSKVVDLLGDALKILLPLILFALGVFIPTRVSTGIDRAKESADVVGTGWVGRLAPETAYFVAVGVLVFLLAVWVAAWAVAVMRYTRLPLRDFVRNYFLDVAAYAWATASSSATIPINLERAGSGLKVRNQVREFIIPLGATINLDGTMMGGFVTAVVAAQMVGYTPTVLDLLFILVPLVIITIGVPGIPGGLAAVAAPIMVELLPLPAGTAASFTAIFIGFNIGLSDMFRTAVNSVDNGILSRLFEHWYPTKFAQPSPQPARQRWAKASAPRASGEG